MGIALRKLLEYSYLVSTCHEWSFCEIIPNSPVKILDSALLVSLAIAMPGEKTYTLAIGKWRRSGTVTIQSVLDTKIARFPIGFLASCGDNSWNYVSFVVSLLVEADPQHPASIIEPNTGLLVNPDDVPVAGTYRFVEQGAFMRSRLSQAFVRLALILYDQANTARSGSQPDRRI